MAQNYGFSLLLCYDVCEGFFVTTEEPLAAPSFGREMILFCPAPRPRIRGGRSTMGNSIEIATTPAMT
jgi:hypothetical protein